MMTKAQVRKKLVKLGACGEGLKYFDSIPFPTLKTIWEVWEGDNHMWPQGNDYAAGYLWWLVVTIVHHDPKLKAAHAAARDACRGSYAYEQRLHHLRAHVPVDLVENALRRV